MRRILGIGWLIAQPVLPVAALFLILELAVARIPTALVLRFLVGSLLAMLGLFLFLQGVRIGLIPAAERIGSILPGRHQVLFLAIVFFIALLATVAEPALTVLADQVSTTSDGRIGRLPLIVLVSSGVAVFVTIAILRLATNIPIAVLYAAGYVVMLALAFLASATFRGVGFDSGGVAAGAFNIPVILALGVGVSSVLAGRARLSDQFGLVGAATLGPVLVVLLLGVLTGG